MKADHAPVKEPQVRGAPVVDRVLDLALQALADHGYAGWTVPEVAARAGLNKTSVYRRWPTKGALVVAALGRSLGHDAPLPDTGSWREDMYRMTTAAVDWATSPVGRGATRALRGEVDDPEVRKLLGTMMSQRGDAPAALFRRAQARGQLGAQADVPIALTLLAGALSHAFFVENEPMTEGFIRRLVAMVADGLERSGSDGCGDAQ
jgi:AcrR family transcriptional regulator